MVMMWMEFECETPLVAKTPETRQHFSFFVWMVPRVYRMRERMTSFFFVFWFSFGNNAVTFAREAVLASHR